MFDPRDDTRGRCEDGRERAYEGRDHTGDPRDVFLRDVNLPLDREREYVLDRLMPAILFVVRTGGATGDGWALKNDASPRGRAP